MQFEPDIPEFVPFDLTKATRIYRNNLPHWRQEGATYFVTYRLADSVPAHVLALWKQQQSRWLENHGIAWDEHGLWHTAFERLPAKDRFAYYKIFNLKLQAYLDSGYGSCLLRNTSLRELANEALRYFHQTRFWLGDYTIMPNHVHALMTPLPGHELEDILASIKKFSSRKINQAKGSVGEQVWQHESYDHIVRDRDELRHFRRYVRENPVKANLREGEYSCCLS